MRDVDLSASAEVLRPSPNKQFIAHVLVPHIIEAGLNYGLSVGTTEKTVMLESTGIHQIAWRADNTILYTTPHSISHYDPTTGERRTVPLSENLISASLSPDGKFITIIDPYANARRTSIKVISTAQFFDEHTDFQPVTYDIPAIGYVRWSPDSRHFIVLYFTSYLGGGSGGRAIQRRLLPIDLFGIDGDGHHNFALLTMHEADFGSMFFPARWSPDGHTLLYLQPDNETNATHLVAYDPITNTSKQLRDNVRGSLYFSFENLPFYDYDTPTQERIAVVYKVKNRTHVDMLDTNGALKQVIVRNADWVSEPLWLQDGNTVVTIWTQRYGSKRHAHLTFAFANGDAPKDFDSGYQDISDFQRLHGKNSKGQPRNAFIYKVQYGDYYGVNIVDLDTFTEYRLVRDLADVIAIEQDSDTIRLWWETPDNVYGVSDYTLDRQPINHLYLNAPFDRAGQVFYSANMQAALVMTSRRSQMIAQLIGSDGRAHIQLSRIKSIPDEVTWSDDRSLVAVAHGSIVEVYETSSGRRLLSQPMKWSNEGLAFTSCKELLTK